MKTFTFKQVRQTPREKKQLPDQLPKDQNIEILELKQAAELLKLKPSYMYSLIHQNKIPHYKPNGKRVYFIKSELIKWILGSKVKTIDEMEADYNKQKQTQTN
jgi:excisionase family DNA binding protein